MRIVVDNQIPFLEGVFPRAVEVCFLPSEEIDRESVRDADALIIRTRTRCDRGLLEGSKVRFIATATIGYDHIDASYCSKAGIKWVSCPGCNAQAVCDYVEEAIRYCRPKMKRCRRIGIVGVGHVGSKVSSMVRRLGMEVVEQDPPRGIENDISGCDIITYHTPLTYNDGKEQYPTYHLCNEELLQRLDNNTLIINAARGGVVDERALEASGLRRVIDCWEGEPSIRESLLLSPNTLLASYHIAGYSLEGKWNASSMCVEALCRFFGMEQAVVPRSVLEAARRGDSGEGWIGRLTEQLKGDPKGFERFRKAYVLR